METSSVSLARRLLEPDVLGCMIPIVLIVMFGGVKIVKSLIVHRERMSLIEMGIHPDYPPEDVPGSGEAKR